MTGYEIAIRLPWNQQYLKYRNPDPRCTYPFDAEPCGYCWSYAVIIDLGGSQRTQLAGCRHCECWKEGAA